MRSVRETIARGLSRSDGGVAAAIQELMGALGSRGRRCAGQAPPPSHLFPFADPSIGFAE